jgi:hypothetical protein
MPSCRGTSFLAPPGLPCACARANIRNGQSMTEQVPEDLTEAEEADRLDVDLRRRGRHRERGRPLGR